MNQLLKWAANIELHMCASTEQWDHVFFSERISYSGSFVEVDTPEEVKAEILKENGTEITIYLDCQFYRGKHSGEYIWGFTPKPERVRLGFAGASMEELIPRVEKWFEDNSDLEQPSCPIPYAGDRTNKIPVIARLKRVPHWKDDKDD